MSCLVVPVLYFLNTSHSRIQSCFVSRFTVEVADFDFGHGVGDMEYKTFRERLREAVVNSFNRDFGVDGEGNVWSPSRKYGSMQ